MLLGPLESVAVRHPWWILPPILGVAFLTGTVLQDWVIGRLYLRTPATPESPILEWEKAGNRKRMDEILAAWGPAGKRWAAASLAVDVAFLLAYGAALSLACSMAAVYFRIASASVGKWLFIVAAWAALVPSALDLVEDGLLFRLLRPYGGDSLPGLMARVSRWKWRLIGVFVPLSIVALAYDLLGCRFGC